MIKNTFEKLKIRINDKKIRKIPKTDMYKGSIYKCTSFPTVASSYFGIPYEEVLVAENKIFIQLRNGLFSELEDLRLNGKNAMKYDIKAKESGDYFVKDLNPLLQEQNDELSQSNK